MVRGDPQPGAAAIPVRGSRDDLGSSDSQPGAAALLDEPPDGSDGWLAGIRFRTPSAFGVAILAVALAVVFVGALTYYGARKFTRDAADVRASEEAASVAEQSAFTATGDAFNGYLQMLRYADEPVVRSMTSTGEQRVAALQQLLYLNTNKLSALAIVARDGTIFASTDPLIVDVRGSQAFNTTRASLSPTNSDIVLPEDGSAGYVEFTTPLRMPDGAVWAILYGRADPDVLWSTTLQASVDGSRNVILNSEGLFAAGVPSELKREPWRGSPLDNGSVQANIVGVDSICGLGPIGRDSQIDHGWHVASCLPISLIQREAGRAMGDQALVTAAGVVLAIVVSGGMLWLALRAEETDESEEEVGADDLLENEPVALSDDSESIAAGAIHDDRQPDDGAAEPPAAAPVPVIVADVDAVRLIDAFERRAARVSEQLRANVQARLLIAASQAQEAYRLRESEPERSAGLHGEAMAELEAVRDRELRGIGQEMYPALVRLGLPGALRALAKEIGDEFALRLSVDAATDGTSNGAGRVAIESQRRLVMFRAVRAAVSTLREAGASSCDLTLTRDGDWLRLSIDGHIDDDAPIDQEEAIDADAIAFAAYGGRLELARAGNSIAIVGDLPAPGIEVSADELVIATDDADGEESIDDTPVTATSDVQAAVVTFAAPLQGPDESLGGALRDLALELAGVIAIELDVPDTYDTPAALDAEVAGSLRMLAGAVAQTLADAGASECRVVLRRAGFDTRLTITSDVRATFDASALAAAGHAIEAHGGTFSVGELDGAVTVSAAVPGQAPADEELPVVVQVRLAPVVAPFVEDDEDAAVQEPIELDIDRLMADDDEPSGVDAA